MIGGRAEIHSGGVDHVAVEILQRAVGFAAAIPAQFGVAMEIAAHDVIRLAVDLRRVAADGAQVAGLVGMASAWRGTADGPPPRFSDRLRDPAPLIRPAYTCWRNGR